MKKFIIYLGIVSFFLVAVFFVLDVFYTKVYENAEPRTKFQYLRSLKNKKIDYVFLGSSRVENNIIPIIIKEKTGKDAVNLGFQASKLSDIYIVLKLIKEYNINAGSILIQIDYIYNIEEGYSNVLQYELMPFVRENRVTNEYFKDHFSERKEIVYFPFYRYCAFGAKIGFREIFTNLINKKTSVIYNQGFVGLYGSSSVHQNSLPTQIKFSNSYFDKIKKFAKINKMPVVFFCAPFCKHTKNLDFIGKLKQKVPELYDFSLVIENDKMFQNCSHLNIEGASYFTEYLVNHMLQ
jgi:hypothetical protein